MNDEILIDVRFTPGNELAPTEAEIELILSVLPDLIGLMQMEDALEAVD